MENSRYEPYYTLSTAEQIKVLKHFGVYRNRSVYNNETDMFTDDERRRLSRSVQRFEYKYMLMSYETKEARDEDISCYNALLLRACLTSNSQPIVRVVYDNEDERQVPPPLNRMILGDGTLPFNFMAEPLHIHSLRVLDLHITNLIRDYEREVQRAADKRPTRGARRPRTNLLLKFDTKWYLEADEHIQMNSIILEIRGPQISQEEVQELVDSKSQHRAVLCRRFLRYDEDAFDFRQHYGLSVFLHNRRDELNCRFSYAETDFGETLVLRAARNIRAGEKLTIAYPR